MLKVIEFLKKYRDLVYIALMIIFVLIISGQCSRIRNMDNELARQANNLLAATEELTNYKDELGRANAEKHAYQLTQKELRDSVGLLKQKNKEYLAYIGSHMNIKDTVTVETVIVKEVEIGTQLADGAIKFNKSDVFGKSSRTLSGSIPYKVTDNTLYTGGATVALDQDIFVEGWLEKNTKTKETFIHLRSDYPGVTFNSGMGIVAQPSKSYDRSVRKANGIGIAVGPNFSLGYDLSHQKLVPTVGVGVTIGYTYTPKLLQW